METRPASTEQPNSLSALTRMRRCFASSRSNDRRFGCGSVQRIRRGPPRQLTAPMPPLSTLPARHAAPKVVYRRAGDYMLVEYDRWCWIWNCASESMRSCMVGEAEHPGILELTPGIRSLQVHYDSLNLPLEPLLNLLMAAEESLPSIDEMQIETRIVHLPLSWDDAATQLAIAKYMQSVRADAPWCPSNIEFIRRINGLDSVDEVKKIVFNASYLELGLVDVYLGAPVCTPLDPRHRLVTTKYNPARTWTPENAVNWRGVFMCVRHGRAGRLHSSAAPARCGTPIMRPRIPHASRGCCDSSIRSGFTRERRGAAGFS